MSGVKEETLPYHLCYIREDSTTSRFHIRPTALNLYRDIGLMAGKPGASMSARNQPVPCPVEDDDGDLAIYRRPERDGVVGDEYHEG